MLQNRWKLNGNTLVYYGLRSGDGMLHNTVKLTKTQSAIIARLPAELTSAEIAVLTPFIGVQIVTEDRLRQTPKSFDEAHFCKTCAANDFMIPGLELDCDGICPMCRTADKAKSLRSVLPIVTAIPRSEKSRFDVAVFYTGGKDSSFILWYLAKRLGLRVLALTWEIPFISDSAKTSIENAKKHFDNVEFITRTVCADDMRRLYKKLLSLSGNTCACPSLAYLLFYPELVSLRVPYMIAGNEPAQMLGIYYNHIAPGFAYSFADNTFLNVLVNIGRILTLRPPFKPGQLQTLMAMKQLAYGDGILKKLSGYESSLVTNAVEAIREVPSLLPPLRQSIRYSSRTGHIPAFVQLDLDAVCGGVYDWKKVRQILRDECGWVEPADGSKAFHTSCSIERCKDHTQFVRFYNCESTMIPFSALEISLASRSSGQTRDELIYEMEHHLGFSLEPLPECADMYGYVEGKR